MAHGTSCLAGILDTYGGLRFVVTHPRDLPNHIRHDETPVVVPGIFVCEPVPWDEIPYIIARIELEVDRWLARGEPNQPHAQEAWRMYQLRKLESPRRSLDLYSIVET